MKLELLYSYAQPLHQPRRVRSFVGLTTRARGSQKWWPTYHGVGNRLECLFFGLFSTVINTSVPLYGTFNYTCYCFLYM